MSSYGNFAWFYDRLTGNVEYDRIAQAVDRYVERFGGTREVLLDLACGTGSVSEKMAGMGYDVIGVDNSEDMLGVAMDKKFDSGLPIQYICQDMTKLNLYGAVDVAICVLDSINHLDSIESIKKTFESVSRFTAAGGLFIFDVNTIYKHREILADNAFLYDFDDFFCGWQNEYHADDNSVDIFLDFFEKNENGSYTRYQENFSEKAYSREKIVKCFEDSSFEMLGEYDDYTDNPLSDKTQRVVYVLKKI